MPAGVGGDGGFYLASECHDLFWMFQMSGWRSCKGEGLILTRSGLEAAQDTVSLVHGPRQFGNKQKPIRRRESDKSKNKQRPRDGKLMRWGWVGRSGARQDRGGFGGAEGGEWP